MNDDRWDQPGGTGDDGREPLFNAPWPAVMIAGVVLASRLAHTILGDAVWGQLAFAPADLAQGRWIGLVTNLFVFPDWLSALIIALFCMVFATPLVRWLGPDRRAAAAAGSLYILGGVAGGLGDAVIHAGSVKPFHAGIACVAALAGAASRLYGREGDLGPPWSPTTIGLIMAGVVIFLLEGAVGAYLGFKAPPEAAGALAAFLVGVLLIGAFRPLATTKLPG